MNSNNTKNNNKQRIAHVLFDLYVGGAEILVLQLIKALGFEQYDHFVYYFGFDGPIKNKFEAIEVPVYRGNRLASIKQPVKFLISLYSLMKDISCFIKTNQISVIQSHLSQPNQLTVVVGKLFNIPVFPTIHSTMAFSLRSTKFDIRVYLKRILNNLIYRIADKIITVSQEVKGIVMQNFGLRDSKVIVVKNGIIFEPETVQHVNLENQYAGLENKLKIIAVGRLTYEKNFEVLIQSARNLLNQGFRDFMALIVGEGENRGQLEKLISCLKVEKHVKLLGLRHDVLSLMKSCDLFVLPSRYEGLSIAMIEAMACGLPTIATDSPGLRNYIIEGENGLHFPVGDDMALAKHIIMLAKNPELKKRLSIGARQSFETEYDLKKNIIPLDLLFKQFAAKQG